MDGLHIYLAPGVFHPWWFLTTRTITDFALRQVEVNDQVLELGAGNGFLALSCSRQGSVVTASDLNPAAVESITRSAIRNELSLKVIHSDLFESLGGLGFDYIFINPPYFPQSPQNQQEHAFFCGPNFEYFHRLFDQLRARSDKQVYMILTNACDLKTITGIAVERSMQMKEIQRKRTWGEEHIIFSIDKL